MAVVVNNRYRVLRRLGAGGGGQVFLASDAVRGGGYLALKVLPPNRHSEAAVASFKREFSALSRLAHPNLAEVYDFGTITDVRPPRRRGAARHLRGGLPFFTAEFIDGQDLFRATADLPAEGVRDLLVQVCRALDYIHSQGVIHYDIKPENILVTRDAQAKLIDFGIADDRPDLRTAVVKGTYLYMSPEVLTGRPVDHRTDLYSLGIVLYQVCAREHPYKRITTRAEDPVEAAAAATPDPARSGIAEPMRTIISRLLRRDPQARYPNPADVIRDLNRLAGTSYEVQTRETTAGYIRSGPLACRREELAALKAAFAAAAARVRDSATHPAVFLVTGEHGIGKSRLVRELVRWVQLQGAPVAVGSCFETPGRAYGPVATLLAECLRRDDAHRFVRERAPEVVKLVPELAGPLRSAPSEPLEPEAERLRLLDATAGVVMDLSADAPLVLCLEDVQWADEGTLDWLAWLARNLGLPRDGGAVRPRCLVVATGREEDLPPTRARRLAELRSTPGVRTLRLGPLDAAGVRSMLAGMLGHREVPEALASRLCEETLGLPFLVEEAVAHLVEEGLLSYREGAWRAEELDPARICLPEGAAALVRRRLERLGETPRELLALLAVLDRPCEAAFLERLLGPEAAAPAALEELVGRRVVVRAAHRERSVTYRVAHTVIQVAVLAGLAPEARRALHGRVAAALEVTPGGGPERPRELARHLDAAGEPARALTPLLAAADRDRESFANEAAIAGYTRALELTREPSLAARIARDLAEVLLLVGRPEEAAGHLEEALSRAAGALSSRDRAELLARLGEAAERTGDEERALAAYADARQALERSDDPALRARLANREAWVYLTRNELSPAFERAAEGLRALRAAAPEAAAGHGHSQRAALRLLGSLYNTIGVAHFRRGELDRAARCYRRNLEISTREGDLKGVAAGLNNLGLLAHRRGEAARAIEHFARSLSIKERLGDSYGMAAAYNNLGGAHESRGDFARAADYFSRARALKERLGDAAGVASVDRNLGRVHRWRADYASALRSLRDACRARSRLEQPERLAEAVLDLAEVHADLGAHARAAGLLDAARRLHPALGPALDLVTARVARGVGEHRRARRAAGRARRRYRDAGAREGRLVACLELAAVSRATARPGRAAAFVAEAVALAQEAQARPLLALAHSARATLAAGQGSELPTLLEALRWAAAAKYPEGLWRVHWMLAEHYRVTDASATARGHYESARDLLRSIAARLPEDLRGSYLAQADARALATALERQAEQERDDRRTAPEATRPSGPECLTGEDLLAVACLAGELARAVRPRALYARLLDLAVARSEAERAFLLTREEGRWLIRSARSADREDLDAAGLDPCRALAERVVQEGSPLVLDDGAPPLEGAPADGGRLRSVCCVPLRVGDRVAGALYLDNRFRSAAFGPRETALAQVLADHAALAWEQARLTREARRRGREAEVLRSRLEVVARGASAVWPPTSPRSERTGGPAVTFHGLISRSPRMHRLFALVERVAQTTVPVLVLGESGTGKELFARALHAAGPRVSAPFVVENCAAVPESLLDEVLFGHAAGAFTGAGGDRPGLFESAHGGTIFLDEVAEMSAGLQGRLLRVLSEGEVRRTGEATPRRVDVRVVAATNRDLRALVDEGRFREDLYYRLNVVRLELPPLRERREDIGVLLEHFLDLHARYFKGTPPRVDPATLARLLEHDWPGNIRELENEAMKMLASGGEASGATASGPQAALHTERPGRAASVIPLAKVRARHEAVAILQALERAEGNKSQAARILGIGRKTLHRRMQKYGL